MGAELADLFPRTSLVEGRLRHPRAHVAHARTTSRFGAVFKLMNVGTFITLSERRRQIITFHLHGEKPEPKKGRTKHQLTAKCIPAFTISVFKVDDSLETRMTKIVIAKIRGRDSVTYHWQTLPFLNETDH